MTTAERIATEVKKTGRVWIVGEMEFPANEGAMVAYSAAQDIAEECGYLVSRNGFSAFTVYPPHDDSRHYSFDWFSPDAKELVKVEVWTPETVWIK